MRPVISRSNIEHAIAVLMLLLGAVGAASAQQTPWRWGGSMSVGIAVPSSDFRELPGTPSCLREDARLASDGGVMFSAGGELGYRPMGSNLELAARLGIAWASTAFAARETIGQATDATSARNDVVVEYRTEIDRLEVRVEPSVRWHLVEPISVSAGVSTAVPLRTTYEQSEVLVAPLQATYLDGSTSRNFSGGSVGNTQPWFGVTAGVAADLEAGSVLVRPELGVVIALGSPIEGIEWQPHEVRVGVAVVFGALGRSTPITPFEGHGD